MCPTKENEFFVNEPKLKRIIDAAGKYRGKIPIFIVQEKDAIELEKKLRRSKRCIKQIEKIVEPLLLNFGTSETIKQIASIIHEYKKQKRRTKNG